MKKIFSHIFLSLLFLISFLSAQNISIEDFRIPSVKYSTLQLSASGKFESYDSDWEPGNGEYSNGSRTVNSLLNFRDVSYDEQNTLSLSAAFRSEFEKNKFRDFHNGFMTQEYTSREREELDLGIEYLRYLEPDRFYISAGMTATGNYRWSEEFRRTSEYKGRSRSVNSDIRIGAGFGKIREGSSVFTVLRILEKLGERNLLRRELTTEEITAIVEVVAKKDQFSSDQERFEKYFFGEIVKELEARNLLVSEKLDAYDVIRISEVLQETILPRFFGMSLEAGSMTDYHYSDNVQASPRLNYYHRYVQEYKGFSHQMYLEGKYGVPLSLRSHFFTVLTAEFPNQGNRYTLLQTRSVSTFLHQFTDRFSGDVTVELLKEIDYLSGIKSTGFWMKNSAAIRYFIENNIFCTFSGDYHYNDQSSLLGFEFGLNYRFF